MPIIENALLTLKGTPLGAQAGKRTAGALAILALASVGLAACGESSSGTASNANAAAKGSTATATSPAATPGSTSSTSASHTGTPATGQSRFSSIRACLQKNGVNLPPPTQTGISHGSNGVPTATLQAALKKCYAGRTLRAFGGPNRPPASSAIRNPVFRQALGKFAACMRQKGVNIPAPSSSGSGPIFSTKGINTSGPQFTSAAKACRGVLAGTLRAHPNGGAARPGAPPVAGQTQGG
jgi:hypothetical protein